MAALDPVPEDWQRGLAVAAHPDDLEYGTASAIARWTSQGKDIAYVLVTDGEAGIDGMEPGRAGPLRRDEELASARVVGVDTDAIDAGVASLEAHRVYLDALPEGTLGTDPDRFLREAARSVGPRLGVELAVAFEVIPV